MSCYVGDVMLAFRSNGHEVCMLLLVMVRGTALGSKAAMLYGQLGLAERDFLRNFLTQQEIALLRTTSWGERLGCPGFHFMV